MRQHPISGDINKLKNELSELEKIDIKLKTDIFLVDEILTVGDEPFQRRCIAKIRELRASGQTLVVVSHDLDLVSSVCERGVVLSRGTVLMDGDIDQAIAYLRETTANQESG